MKLALIISVIFLILIFPDCIEKGWKGISVLRTTRDEVEKILGQPINEDFDVSYRKDDAIIHITYSNSPCSDTKSYQGIYKVQQNTVLQYRVIVKKELKLSEFEWERDLYERVEDKESRNRWVNYNNQKNGIRIMTIIENGVEMVRRIQFEPTVEQNTQYRCENE